MSADTPLLQLEAIDKIYQTGEQSNTLTVLNKLSLTVRQGESIAVIGPSGSGKSTLLNIIGAMDHPTLGSVRLQGQSLSSLDDKQLAGIRNQKIGFVFQFHHLLPQCSVLENVLIPTLISPDKNSREKSREKAISLLERVGLSQRLSHRPGQLSGGECQRVAVVRSLINDPKLILADEPTGSLDQKNSEILARLLVDLNKEYNTALIVATHAIDLAKHMKKRYTLDQGSLKKYK